MHAGAKRILVLLPPGGAPEGYFESVVRMAKEAGLRLRATYVIEALWFSYSAADWLSTGPSRAGFDEYMRDTLRAEGERLAAEFSQEAARAGVEVSTQVEEGDPTGTIIKAARDWRADAVVIPSGMKGLKACLEELGLRVVVHTPTGRKNPSLDGRGQRGG